MDAQELRNLQEAYSQVYELDEAIRNPESRKKLRAIMDTDKGRKGDASKGENPRSKYPSEKSKQASHLLHGSGETGSKGNPVRSRGGTSAPPEERDRSAANRKYWAGNAGPTRDRGAGNKAARRAAALNKEQVDLYDIILSHLLDEGYADTQEAAEAIMVNMSEEWRENICEAEIEPPKERVGALTNIDIPMSEREAARQRTLAKAKEKREKKKN